MPAMSLDQVQKREIQLKESMAGLGEAPDVVVETVAIIGTPVSLGAVSDVKKPKRSQCSSSRK